MIGVIFSQSANGIIGVGGRIPWYFPGDLRRFKRMTVGSVVVMGRRTHESIGRALPGRVNVVISSRAVTMPEVAHVRSVAEALDYAEPLKGKPVWFIGGTRVYEEALAHAGVVDRTWVPVTAKLPPCADCVHEFGEHIPAARLCLDGCGCERYVGDVAWAPQIDHRTFSTLGLVQHEDEPELKREVLLREGAEEPYQDFANRELQELGYLTRGRPCA